MINRNSAFDQQVDNSAKAESHKKTIWQKLLPGLAGIAAAQEGQAIPQMWSDMPIEADINPSILPSTNSRHASLPAPNFQQEMARVAQQSSKPQRLVLNQAQSYALPRTMWLEVKIRSQDDLVDIFERTRIQRDDLRELANLGRQVSALENLKPETTMRLHRGDNNELLELQYQYDDAHLLRVSRSGSAFESAIEARTTNRHIVRAQGVVEQSVYSAAIEAGMSGQLIEQMVSIFSWEVDFLDIQPGDRFSVLYEEKYINGQPTGEGIILGAEFVNAGRAVRAVRYTDSMGRTDYYTPEGRSLRAAFIRTPVDYVRISSYFAARRIHPVLNTIRAHKGVDYAAPIGTPVKSTGRGVIEVRGVKNGFGNVIIVDHGRGYKTVYGHLDRFDPKVSVGGTVRQGQVIGYVGKSGLATGPHLHYEFRINGVHQDPLTVKLPENNLMNPTELRVFKDAVSGRIKELNEMRRFRVATAG